MKVLFLHGWQSVPGGVKPTFLAQHGHEIVNPKLPDDDFGEAVQIAVPLFLGHQITLAPSRVGYKTKAAELLLRSPFEIPRSAKLFVFSEADLASVRLLNLSFEVQFHRSEQFEWYCGQDRVEPRLRATVNNYFRAEDSRLSNLDFDQLRPS